MPKFQKGHKPFDRPNLRPGFIQRRALIQKILDGQNLKNVKTIGEDWEAVNSDDLETRRAAENRLELKEKYLGYSVAKLKQLDHTTSGESFNAPRTINIVYKVVDGKPTDH
jgi:hypothetical protein